MFLSLSGSLNQMAAVSEGRSRERCRGFIGFTDGDVDIFMLIIFIALRLQKIESQRTNMFSSTDKNIEKCAQEQSGHIESEYLYTSHTSILIYLHCLTIKIQPGGKVKV